MGKGCQTFDLSCLPWYFAQMYLCTVLPYEYQIDTNSTVNCGLSVRKDEMQIKLKLKVLFLRIDG